MFTTNIFDVLITPLLQICQTEHSLVEHHEGKEEEEQQDRGNVKNKYYLQACLQLF